MDCFTRGEFDIIRDENGKGVRDHFNKDTMLIDSTCDVCGTKRSCESRMEYAYSKWGNWLDWIFSVHYSA